MLMHRNDLLIRGSSRWVAEHVFPSNSSIYTVLAVSIVYIYIAHRSSYVYSNQTDCYQRKIQQSVYPPPAISFRKRKFDRWIRCIHLYTCVLLWYYNSDWWWGYGVIGRELWLDESCHLFPHISIILMCRWWICQVRWVEKAECVTDPAGTPGISVGSEWCCQFVCVWSAPCICLHGINNKLFNEILFLWQRFYSKKCHRN